jgi:hypothetical protein
MLLFECVGGPRPVNVAFALLIFILVFFSKIKKQSNANERFWRKKYRTVIIKDMKDCKVSFK